MAADRGLALTPDASSHPTDADRLIRQLESQLRRQLTGTGPSVDLAEAGRGWVSRMHDLLPAVRGDIRDVATALEAIDPLPGTARNAGISQAMRLLARMRSGAPGRLTIPNTMTARTPPPASTNGATALATPLAHAPYQSSPSVERRPNHGSVRLPPDIPQSPIAPTATAGPRVPAHRAITATEAGVPLTGRKKGGSTRTAGITRAARSKTERPGSVTLQSPIQDLPRFDRRYGDALEKLGIRQIGDLLKLYPRRYDDYSQLLTVSQLRPGMEVTVEVRVLRCEAIGPYNRPGRRVEALLADPTGSIRAVWFRQEWITKQLKAGMDVYVSGRVEVFGGRLQFTSPSHEAVSEREAIHTGRLVPVYPLSGALKQNWLRARMKWIVDELAHTVEDPLPDGFRRRWSLLPLHEATQQIHFPDDEDLSSRARGRMAFDNLLLLQLGMLRHKREWQQSGQATPLRMPDDRLASLASRLPFELTGAQARAIREILADMASDRPMSRLLQGDVGSGKTVVAALAMLAAVEQGCQAALMAPTEILAEQHARTLATIFEAIDPMLKPVLITGSMREADKARAWNQVGSGQAQVIVGTHALIQERGEFSRLALAIVDEQHRLGVHQREALRLGISVQELLRRRERRAALGDDPGEPNDRPAHFLTMTATPIPRTLSLTVHADLDLTTIDAMPVGRRQVKTRYAPPDKRDAAYAFLQAQVQQGRQAFVICPLVEESEAVEAKAATVEYQRLKTDVFPELRLALIHGQLKPADKEATMRHFRDHELDILVATTVVEVGVDIPNASVILIESAERFGLAQLHQLRGRVGRGEHQSFCILMASDQVDEAAQERLRVVESTTDGFRLSEEDLRLRGPGAFFGVAQSGIEPWLQLADVASLERARHAATDLLEQDADLSAPEHRMLATRVAGLMEQLAEWH